MNENLQHLLIFVNAAFDIFLQFTGDFHYE